MAEPAAERLPMSHIRQLRERGERGLIFGESHEDLAPAAFIKENMGELARLGFRTLFVEMPHDLKPFYDAAAAGEPGARDRLRAIHVAATSSSGLHVPAMFSSMVEAAMDAGLRVRPVDMSIDTINGYDMATLRLPLSDPQMASRISAEHGNQPWLMLVGSAHTYAGGYGGQCLSSYSDTPQLYSPEERRRKRCAPEDFLLTEEGGLNSRLLVSAIDISSRPDVSTLEFRKGEGVRSEWQLSLPEHPLQSESWTRREKRDERMHGRGHLLLSATELRTEAASQSGVIQAMSLRTADAAIRLERMLADGASMGDLQEQQSRLAGLSDVLQSLRQKSGFPVHNEMFWPKTAERARLAIDWPSPDVAAQSVEIPVQSRPQPAVGPN
jgi:hypothetical protein